VNGVSEAGRIQLYGWDSRGRAWCGPTILKASNAPRRLVAALRGAPARQWYGIMRCGLDREPQGRFFIVIHRLNDCATAMIYCHESRTGPLEILTAIPARLRPRLRPEFAFEFVAYAQFLGAFAEESAMSVHNGIVAGLAESRPGDSLVFSLSTGLWSGDLDYVLSRCVEKVAAGMLEWLQE
jgi:hypothetical protein